MSSGIYQRLWGGVNTTYKHDIVWVLRQQWTDTADVSDQKGYNSVRGRIPQLLTGILQWIQTSLIVVLGGINIMFPVYSITNSKRYSVFHGILIKHN